MRILCLINYVSVNVNASVESDIAARTRGDKNSIYRIPTGCVGIIGAFNVLLLVFYESSLESFCQ